MRIKREYVPYDLKIDSWNSIEKYFNDLLHRKIKSTEDLKTWLKHRSELEAVLNEDLGWRYINMNCTTEDQSLAAHFEHYVTEIEPKKTEMAFELNLLLNKNPFIQELKGKAYEIMLRTLKNEIDLFRKSNIPIQAEIQKEEQEYGRIAGAMSINYQGEEMTLQKATNYLKNTDRKVRQEVYEMIWNRRLRDKEGLNNLLSKLITKRQQLAKNADFGNFRDYMFRKLGRFDYSVEDCYQFHESVKTEVVPLVEKIQQLRKQKLGYKTLKPWDLDVDVDLKPALIPFENADELITKTIGCFRKIKPGYAGYLEIMQKERYLDLDSRKGKAPGGFNYPLHESNVPFIFMNATGNLRDLETMVHEGGHAIHSFLAKDLELVQFKETPSEIAELASMSMELISMEHWDTFFENPEDLKRAKRSQLMGIIDVLPWVAKVDKFQHLLYLENDLSTDKRMEMWRKTNLEFSGHQIDWNGQEDNFNHLWQTQLHIFEVPFYYIEYGFAQLGAIAVWRNYKKNPQKAIQDYENALKLGYTQTIPEVYKTAGIEFNFSKKYIKELMDFVQEEIDKL